MSQSQSSPHISVIGGGAFGINHIRTLHQLGALHSIVETSSERRQQLSQDYPDIPLHPNTEAILADPQVQGTVIATPAHTHSQLATQTLQAHKDTFIEKPMTLESTSAEALCQLADKQQRILMVGHLLLYQPAIQHIKKALQSGTIGQLHSVHQIRAKHGRARKHENVLWSFGVHDIAVLLELIDQQPSHISYHGHSSHTAGIDDDAHLHLTFPSGTQAHLHNSWLWPQVARRLTLIGEHGMIVYDELQKTVTLHKKTIEDNDQGIPTNHDQGSQILYPTDTDTEAQAPLTLELQHFLDCIQSRKTPRSDGHNGLQVVRILEQASPAH